MEQNEKLLAALKTATKEKTLKKLILSRPSDKDVIRTEGRLFTKGDKVFLQLETFKSDGKAYHKNFSDDEAPDAVFSMLGDYRQLNILTTGGDLEARLSSKGKLLVSGKLGSGRAISSAHDRKKNNILNEGTLYPFLSKLGVTDGEGRVYDKKRAKFRQIDRFLHYIDDIYPRLGEGDLYILDLCCGKSYLTFAAYWYLTEVKGRSLKMVGADRKADVISYCREVAKSLGYDGLSFLCCDINDFLPERRPNLVLSLHACDVATDIVLITAAKLGAEVILSTPCCQHEINSQLNGATEVGRLLSPVLEHSLLKQKLAVAITDALRCKRLEACGYAVDVTELIDPENTPKNLMIRAYRVPMTEKKRQKHRKEFEALSDALGISLFGGIGDAASDRANISYKKS